MEFKINKLHTENQKKYKLKPNIKKTIWITVILIILFYLIRFMSSGAGLKEFVLSFGEPLQVDKNGQTNFFLVGTGGELHEGADLTDSILIVSLNSRTNTATMLSVPRDLYIDTKLGFKDRINKIYTLAKNEYEDSNKGLETLMNATGEALGIDLHYYVKINFEGFAEVVDMIEGVDLYVDATIDDKHYPKEGTIKFEPFYLSKGMHHLDGETALKYARSRKTTSDFDRSHRQQKLLFAIKNKIVSKGMANDPDELKNIFLSLKEDIETNLSIRELIRLAEMSKEFNENAIKTFILHDDPSNCGGFLFTPERSQYGGAFVLIPASNPFTEEDNYVYLHFFTKEVFPRLRNEYPEIQILNGTGTPGLAGQTKILLKRHCMNVNRFGNAQSTNIQQTKIYARTEAALASETIKLIQDFFGIGEITTDIPQVYLEDPYLSDAEIVIELGEDYANSPNIDPFDYLIDMTPKDTESAEDAEDTENTTNTKSEPETETPSEITERTD